MLVTKISQYNNSFVFNKVELTLESYVTALHDTFFKGETKRTLVEHLIELCSIKGIKVKPIEIAMFEIDTDQESLNKAMFIQGYHYRFTTKGCYMTSEAFMRCLLAKSDPDNLPYHDLYRFIFSAVTVHYPDYQLKRMQAAMMKMQSMTKVMIKEAKFLKRTRTQAHTRSDLVRLMNIQSIRLVHHELVIKKLRGSIYLTKEQLSRGKAAASSSYLRSDA